MKKTIAFFTALCMLISTNITFVFANDISSENDYAVSWDTLKGLNLMNYNDEQKDDIVSRGDFAEFIAYALDLIHNSEDSTKTAPTFGRTDISDGFSDSEEDTNLPKQLFSDVDESSPYFQAVNAVKENNIMNGDGNGNFEPDNNIMYEEIIKTFVVMCGYEAKALVKGGWYIGYAKTANDLDITLDSKKTGETVTKSELCEMFYKVITVPVNTVKEISNDTVYFDSTNDKTFLSEYLDIDYVEGQLTEVENSSITTAFGGISNTIKIGDKTIKNNFKLQTSHFLGRNVTAYYGIKNNKDVLLYITLNEDDDVTVINAKDILEYSGGVITYNDNNRTKKINIKNYPLIYNGAAKKSFTKELFDFEFGDVTVTNGNDNDAVIVRDYRDMIISSISIHDDEIYGYNTDTILNVSDTNIVNCYDSDGSKLSLEQLTSDMAITYLNGENYKEIYVVDAKRTGTISQINAEGEYAVIDDVKYEFSRNIDPKIIGSYLGKEVKFYINKSNCIFNIEVINEKNEKQGYLTGVSTPGSTLKNSEIKVFTSDGKFEIYTVAKSVSVYSEHSSTSVKISNKDINGINALNGYIGFITYKVNADNEVTSIQVPLSEKILKTENDGRIWAKKVKSTLRTNKFSTSSNSIGTQVYFDSSVNIYSIPQDGDADEYYIIKYNNFSNLDYFGDLVAYYGDEDTLIPRAVVVSDWTPYKAKMSIPSNLAVITKMWESLDANGEEIKNATVVNAEGVEANIYSEKVATDDRGNDCTVFDAAYVDFDSERKAVGVGDIIAYTTMYGTTDNVAAMELVYDCDMQNMSGGKKGWLAPSLAGSDLYYTVIDPDVLWGSNTQYDNLSEIISPEYDVTGKLARQNPIRIEPNGDVILKTNGHRDYNGGRKFMLGYVTDKTDAFVKLTTQDLSIDGSVWSKSGVADVQIPCPDTSVDYKGFYWQETFKYVNQNGYILTIEYYDNDVKARKGVPADIYSYKDAQNEASRVLADPVQRRYYIINDYRTK